MLQLLPVQEKKKKNVGNIFFKYCKLWVMPTLIKFYTDVFALSFVRSCRYSDPCCRMVVSAEGFPFAAEVMDNLKQRSIPWQSVQ